MIKANFSTYGTYVTDSLYQWDINRTLVVNGLNLEQAPEIHFYNANMERAIVRQSTLDNGVATVTIPNSLLQEALTIKADVCIYEDNVRKTIENIEIPVKAKSRPLDYVFEDDGGDLYSYNALISKFDEHIRNTEATLKEAKDRYNELIDEMGRIKGEYPGVPDRVTKLEKEYKMQIVSYVGTGTSGENNPCSITFDFPPQVVLALYNCSTSDASNFIMKSESLTTEYIGYTGFKYDTTGRSWGKKSEDGKTFYWYLTDSSAIKQLNSTSERYYFLGIGLKEDADYANY